jgi:uncharacterized protein YjiS (DUF1127 family)
MKQTEEAIQAGQALLAREQESIMRDYVLFQSQVLDRSRSFPVLGRLISNWRKRGRLRDLEQLDDHVLNDIGFTRTDVMAVLSQPLSVDPVWELERRAMLRRNQAMPDATRRWLNDRAFAHPRID